jgi:hypothetical protein
LACTTDADCTGITTGKCASGLCVYDACTTDADCGSAGLCNCLGQPTPGGFGPLPQGNVCLAADCHVDADCGAGFFCALSPSTAVVPAGGYGCTTCEDECSSHNGCPGGTAAEPENYSLCAFDPAVKHWDCQLEPDAE